MGVDYRSEAQKAATKRAEADYRSELAEAERVASAEYRARLLGDVAAKAVADYLLGGTFTDLKNYDGASSAPHAMRWVMGSNGRRFVVRVEDWSE